MAITQFDLWCLVLGAVAGAGLCRLSYTRPHREVYTLGLALFLAAAVYVLFALFPFQPEWIKVEATGLFLYLIFWRLGMRFGLLWIGVGWLLHPVWDLGLHFYGAGREIAPRWYVFSCLSFDLVVGLYCVWRATAGRPRLAARRPRP